MTEKALLVFSTFPDAATAQIAARKLVEERLAACANIVPQIESIYRWQGKVESAAEVFVIFKTMPGCYQPLEQRLRELHPYEIPEIIRIPVQDGLPAYLNWIAESCRSTQCPAFDSASHKPRICSGE